MHAPKEGQDTIMDSIETRPFTRILMLAGLMAATAAGQSFKFDDSGNATLQGRYFVREVALLNLSAQGAIGEAIGAIGIATFGIGSKVFSFLQQTSVPHPFRVSCGMDGAPAIPRST